MAVYYSVLPSWYYFTAEIRKGFLVTYLETQIGFSESLNLLLASCFVALTTV